MNRLLIAPLVTAAKWLCALSFATFCVLTLLQVVNRYALGLPMFWTEEVALLLFVWSVMIGVPVALWERQEMAVDILNLQPGRARTAMGLAADAASLAFLALLAVSGWMLIDRAGAATTPAADLPRWIAYASIPAGALLGALVLIGRRLRPPTDAHSTEAGDADYAHD